MKGTKKDLKEYFCSICWVALILQPEFFVCKGTNSRVKDGVYMRQLVGEIGPSSVQQVQELVVQCHNSDLPRWISSPSFLAPLCMSLMFVFCSKQHSGEGGSSVITPAKIQETQHTASSYHTLTSKHFSCIFLAITADKWHDLTFIWCLFEVLYIYICERITPVNAFFFPFPMQGKSPASPKR